jgi:hypothetical protein
MLAEFAAYESDRMGDIWREIQARRIRLGMPPVGREQFGYRKVKGVYVIDKRTGPMLGELYRRYNKGASFTALAAWLHAQGVRPMRPRGPQTRWTSEVIAPMMDRGFAAGFITHPANTYPAATPRSSPAANGTPTGTAATPPACTDAPITRRSCCTAWSSASAGRR